MSDDTKQAVDTALPPLTGSRRFLCIGLAIPAEEYVAAWRKYEDNPSDETALLLETASRSVENAAREYVRLVPENDQREARDQ